jgi:hypothetical protein
MAALPVVAAEGILLRGLSGGGDWMGWAAAVLTETSIFGKSVFYTPLQKE